MRRSHFDESRQRHLKLRRLSKSISRQAGRPVSNRIRLTPWRYRWPGSNRQTSIFRHPDTRTGGRLLRYHWPTRTGIRNSGSSFCTGIHKSALNTPSLSTGCSFYLSRSKRRPRPERCIFLRIRVSNARADRGHRPPRAHGVFFSFPLHLFSTATGKALPKSGNRHPAASGLPRARWLLLQTDSLPEGRYPPDKPTMLVWRF